MAQQYGLAMDTPFIQDLIKLGINQGKEEGRIQEQVVFKEMLQGNVLEVLASRFHDMVNPKTLSQHLEKLSLPLLLEALNQANSSSSLADFMAWLESA